MWEGLWEAEWEKVKRGQLFRLSPLNKGLVVERRRIELPTSALRTRRSPS